ncbi:MAG: hypothetical protein N4A71_13510 [Carboxylicivirga sp.]|nr:hypothetical protein [Carboxylicivirga sp.]
MKQLPLNRLLMLQMLYSFCGVMYNVGSLIAVRNGHQAWASTDALVGILIMSLYGLFISTGLLKSIKLYRVVMGVFVLLLGYGGVISHLLNYGNMELYQSVYTWLGAILINVLGLILNFKAALGKFKQT